MKLLDFILSILQKSKTPIRILFPEGDNEKVQAVALKIINDNSPVKNFITPVLLFNNDKEIPSNIKNSNIKTLSIEENQVTNFTNQLYELRKAKGLTLEAANKLVLSRNYYGMMLLNNKEVNGFVGGITFTTADILRPALQIIGPKAGTKTVSSTFIMNKNEEIFLFSDGSINLNPTAEQLADIAKSTIHFGELLEFNPIKLAMLSYSTNTSGSGESVDKVRNATNFVQQLKLKNVQVVGPIQFDAAWDQEVRNKKFPELTIKNHCNAFIFPTLDAANIGYKIAQRLGDYKAIGPIVLGLNQPVNDLSRGATIDDIYYTALITAIQTLIKN
ncbi:phosphate acetyltransferase [Spiroplasma endosymbiont of Lasioglossum malachurum]|uniref:phosphate acetyltransferase n=1 Tax=Spiroplasma endosymbiont of Lasioglossum malachurum TaxID=3066319 RepID=UPI0030D4CB26